MPLRKRKPLDSEDGSYAGEVLRSFDLMDDRCTECGYTKEDSAMWMDHHLCKGQIQGEKESKKLDSNEIIGGCRCEFCTEE